MAGIESGMFRAWVDGHVMGGRSIPSGAPFDSYAPESVASYGLHAGGNFDTGAGALYVGAFIGGNRFQGDDATTANGHVTGTLGGVEAEMRAGNLGIFGQIGHADMVGDTGDTAFKGRFWRFGMGYDFDPFSIAVAYERGHSPDIFDDNGDWGRYQAFEVTFERRFTDRMSGFVQAAVSDFTANDEDSASSSRVTLGLRVNLGQENRTNLTTTYYPGLAAAWAEVLD